LHEFCFVGSSQPACNIINRSRNISRKGKNSTKSIPGITIIIRIIIIITITYCRRSIAACFCINSNNNSSNSNTFTRSNILILC